MGIQEKTIEKYERVKALIDGGMKMDDALHKEAMGSVSYYKIKNMDKGKSDKKPRKPYTKKPKFVDLVNPHTGSNVESLSTVAVIVCTPSQLKAVIASIQCA